MIGFCELVVIIDIIYYLFYVIYPLFLDCDPHLSIKEKFGQPIENLKGKVVWITGASSGLGEHLAYVLAKVNCKLILSARRCDELNRVKENCLKVNSNMQSNDIEIMIMDICDTDNHKKHFDHVIEKFGKLDILVNNAGRSQRANWEKIHLQVDKDLFHLNVFSTVALSRLVYSYFAKIGQGHMVVVSSIAGIAGIPFSGSYTGSKHALKGYFDCLRWEKMNKNIPITAIYPGAVHTPFLSESFTENPNEKFGMKAEPAKNKMSPERCDHLMTVAIANKIDECCIATVPGLQITYIMRYYPKLTGTILRLLDQKYLQRLRDNKVTVSSE